MSIEVIPPPFDPANGKLGIYPYLSPSNMPLKVPGSSGNEVGYAKSVLRFAANQTVTIEPLPGPWRWGTLMTRPWKNDWKLWTADPTFPVDGNLNLRDWEMIQYLAFHNMP